MPTCPAQRDKFAAVPLAGNSCATAPPAIANGTYGTCAVPATSGTKCTIRCATGYVSTATTLNAVCDGGVWTSSGTCAPKSEFACWYGCSLYLQTSQRQLMLQTVRTPVHSWQAGCDMPRSNVLCRGHAHTSIPTISAGGQHRAWWLPTV
jgi:hypothetical protein